MKCSMGKVCTLFNNSRYSPPNPNPLDGLKVDISNVNILRLVLCPSQPYSYRTSFLRLCKITDRQFSTKKKHPNKWDALNKSSQ